jgi:hypothetical protein
LSTTIENFRDFSIQIKQKNNFIWLK